jgi:hypothetical protein
MGSMKNKYRVVDYYGRVVGPIYDNFSEANATRVDGSTVQILERKYYRWAPVTCIVQRIEVGQRFASSARLVVGRETIGEIDPVPFGFSVEAAAQSLAEKLGVSIAE